jgi:SAM-dependent methyltransferase
MVTVSERRIWGRLEGWSPLADLLAFGAILNPESRPGDTRPLAAWRTVVWKRLLRRAAGRLDPEGHGSRPQTAGEDDEVFLTRLYRELLGREPDPDGMASHLAFLREGHPRESLVLNFVRSPEYIFRTIRDHIHDYVQLLPIIDERPGQYRIERNRTGTEKSRFFMAEREADFDWLESKIVGNGYYERPGVWSFIIDEDKRMMAAIAAFFRPSLVLDIGCSNGAVLQCLREQGIEGEGVEVSRIAFDKALPEIRERIHLGDLLALSLGRQYDLVLGLDVFEHLNPNKLDAYLSRIAELVPGGGHVFTNIPAFGRDASFGEVFPIDYPIWDADATATRLFRAVPVDDYGYPKNGHLINADAVWWTRAFERHGFARRSDLESELHRTYDAEIDRIAPARRSFLVLESRPRR